MFDHGRPPIPGTTVPTAYCLLPTAYIISMGHAQEPAVVLLALRLQRVNRNTAGDTRVHDQEIEFLAGGFLLSVADEFTDVGRGDLHAAVLGAAGVVIKKLPLVADLQNADERDEEARDAAPGHLDHGRIFSPPPRARIKSRPSSTTQAGRMLNRAMNRPLPVAVMAGA